MEAELTIGQLADRVGMTVRNVRAHATRGLLPPPRLQGRTGLYGPEHLRRLELIARLQGEGFSLAAIERLLAATPGQTAEDALGQYLQMLAPWAPEPAVELGAEELVDWLGVTPGPQTVEDLLAAGLVERLDTDGRLRVPNPTMLRAGAEAVRQGLPVDELLAMREQLVGHAEAAAETFIGLFRDTVWRPFVDAGMPDDAMVEVRRLVPELQPIAAMAFVAAFREVMPRAVGQFVVEASAALGESGPTPRDGAPR